MATFFRRYGLLAPLAVVLVAVFAWAGPRLAQPATGGIAQTPDQVPAPSAWRELDQDAPFGCGPAEAHRDGVKSFWAYEYGHLHLRLVTAAAPGWVGGTGGWSDARYQWRLQAGPGGPRYLVLVEDFPAKAGFPGAPPPDGRGEVTFLDDPNGNGVFSDDWAKGVPPPYVDNGIGSPWWRRSWSTTTGPSQASNQGNTAEVGFRLWSNRTKGETGIDVWVQEVLLQGARQIGLRWVTDPEDLDLDTLPQCDHAPAAVIVDLDGAVEPPPTDTPRASATAYVPPTLTRTPAPVPATVTPPPTIAPVEPTDTPTATPTATVTLVPTLTRTPTAVPSNTPWPSATRTATAEPTDTPAPTATRTAAPPSPTSTTVPPSPTATALAPTFTPPAPSPTMAPLEPSDTPAPSSTVAPSPTRTATAQPYPPTATPTPPPFPPSPTAWPPLVTATAAPPTATQAPWLATPTGTFPTPGGTPTPWATSTRPPPPPAGTGCLGVCLQLMVDGQPRPFPVPATVHVQLLTPTGAPAAPARQLTIGPEGCVLFTGLEAGQYRIWITIPPQYGYFPGTPPTQTVWVRENQPCSQAIFRFVLAACPCPPGVPTPPGPPGGIPTPPGPPGGIPTPPGTPGPGMPTPPLPPLVPSPTPTVTYRDQSPVADHALLPVLNYLGNDAVCGTWIEVQNVGDHPAKAILIAWGAPGFCPPQCAGPLKVECSGLLVPGSAWHFLGAQIPTGAKSGMVISASVDSLGYDVFADALCEALFQTVVGDCDDYRRFRKAYLERGVWNGFDFGRAHLQPLAVEVLRDCPGDLRPGVRVNASYTGVTGEFLGRWDSVYGGYAFFAPSLYASVGGVNSIVYIQNAGLECTSLELWFKGQNDCLRPRVCDVLTLAPGESHQFDVSSCMPPGWVGGAWVRASQPLAIAVDHVGNDTLMTYTGTPSELNYVFNGQPVFTTGSGVAYGPLVYSEYQGWDTTVVVQNLSAVTNAKVKVYFLDRSGDIITTVADWVCPRGSQTFFLPVIATLPGNWVGSVRVESQEWFAPGAPAVSAPNIHAVAQLVQYTDIARSEPQEAIAYNLFPESLAYDWQLGAGPGGLYSGVGRVGIPSLLKDRARSGVTTEIAIANVVPKPGFTNFAMYIYDQNGLIDFLCESLSDRQVEYVNLNTWGFINPGFRGSAVLSATFWEHDVFDSRGGFLRNVVGLAAVTVERVGTVLGDPIPGDESAGTEAIPIPGPFLFLGPGAPRCPGEGGRLPPVP